MKSIFTKSHSHTSNLHTIYFSLFCRLPHV
uniref:Uncharacterized protein n=1 Tax=Rhizophora mucronata TaxID=61149 RepID=A0A2P2P2S9_RHIMU